MNKRVILITAANGGIGQAIAETFLSKASESILCLAVHQRREDVDRLQERYPDRCHVFVLDVTKPESWGRVVGSISDRWDRLDVLVNNAGGHDDALLAQMPPESWSQTLALNLDSVFHGCQAVLPMMISKRFGRIINIASLSALLAPPGQANYAAAKAGVVGLTQSVAKEVARIGITVNAVCPGYVETLSLKAMDTDARRKAQLQIPMRRFGKPSEVGALVGFLASDDAAYITGAAIKIDGGIL